MPAPMCRAQAHCPDDRRGFGCCALLRAPFGGALGRFRARSGLFFGRVMLPDECAGDLRFKNREAAFQFGAHFHCAVAVHLVGVNGRASRHVDNAERARLGCLVDRRMNFVHRDYRCRRDDLVFGFRRKSLDAGMSPGALVIGG